MGCGADNKSCVLCETRVGGTGANGSRDRGARWEAGAKGSIDPCCGTKPISWETGANGSISGVLC